MCVRIFIPQKNVSRISTNGRPSKSPMPLKRKWKWKGAAEAQGGKREERKSESMEALCHTSGSMKLHAKGLTFLPIAEVSYL